VRTRIAREGRWRRSDAATGPRCSGACTCAACGGWAVSRGYHLLQLPFVSRRMRVLSNWLAAAAFRRDVSELTLATRSNVANAPG